MTQPITAARESAPRGGLASAVGLGVVLPSAPDPLDPDGNWERDTYQLEGPPCRSTYRRGDDCAGQDDPQAGPSLLVTGPVSHPFTVEGAVHCSTFGSMPPTPATWQEATDRQLELCQWSEIAEELWTGTTAIRKGWDNRYLASSDAVVAVEDASPTAALSALEDRMSLCTCGGVCLIHMSVAAVAYFDEAGLLHADASGRQRTANGSLVVADPGYDGSGPGGIAATACDQWIYATSLLTARLGEIRHAQESTAAMVAYQTNDIRYRSERKAAVSWLCCHFAANFTL